MNVQQLHHDRVSISEIGRRLNLDRKTVRKYLKQAPHSYERQVKGWKIDPFRAYLRERWELGVQNSARLFAEIQKRGYTGCATQVKKVVRPLEERGPGAGICPLRDGAGEQAQMDWGHLGNWGGKRFVRVCADAVLVSDAVRGVHPAPGCGDSVALHGVHALEFFKGVPQTVLTDNMKTVVLDRIDGQPCFYQQELVAEHRMSSKRGEMVIERAHYASLPRRSRVPILHTTSPVG